MSPTDPMLPVEPLLRYPEMVRAGGFIGTEPEHFRVDEVPLYQPAGQGDHWYVRLQKRCMNTSELEQVVAAAAGVQQRDVGRAGLKDFMAVTSQWLSVPASGKEPALWQLDDSRVSVLEVSRHTNKLRPGHLRANRFTITVQQCDRPAADAVLQALAVGGFYNFYGAQRFGRHGSNLPKALSWLYGRAPRSRNKARLLATLYPSVLQSEFFNRYACLRIGTDETRLLQGEYIRLHGTGSYRQIADSESELPSLQSGDYHLTGPLPGGRLRASTNEAIALENQVWTTFGLDDKAMDRLMREVDGTRRDLIIVPDEFSWSWTDLGELILTFELPPGAYATMLVRELTREPWFSAPQNPGPDDDDSESEHEDT